MYFNNFKNRFIKFSFIKSHSFFIFKSSFIFKAIFISGFSRIISRSNFLFFINNFYISGVFSNPSISGFLFFSTESSGDSLDNQDDNLTSGGQSDDEEDNVPSQDTEVIQSLPASTLANNPSKNNTTPVQQQANINTPKISNDKFSEEDSLKSDLITKNSSIVLPILPIESAKVSDFYIQPKDIQKEQTEKFNFKSQLYDKYNYISDSYSFLKSQQLLNYLNQNKDFTFITFIYFIDVYKIFLRAHMNIIISLQPVSFSYIIFLDLVIRSAAHSGKDNTINPNVASNFILFSNVLPGIPYFVGSATYGHSLGGYDLIAFIPTSFYSMHFSLKVQNENVSSLVINYFPDKNSTLSKDISMVSNQDPIFVFDVQSFGSRLKFNYESSRTIFNKKSFHKLFNELFEFEKTKDGKNILVKAEYMMQSTPTRSSITARDQSGSYKTFSSGYATENVTLSNINFNFSDIQMMNIILFLFHLPNFERLTPDQTNEILRYISSIITTNIVNQVINVLNINYIFLEIDFTIKIRNENLNNINYLHNKYKSYVDSGLIVPLTPLHFKFYFNSDIFNFYKFILSSVLVIPSLNESIRTVSPHIDDSSKSNFYNYAVNKDMLNSDYYNGPVTYSPIPSIAISWNDFIEELAVKNFLYGQFHSSIPIISSGLWKGISASSLEVKSAYNNSFFIKFNLIEEQEINKYIDTLLWKDNTHPYFIKKSCKIVNILPNTFHRFVYSESDHSYVLDLSPEYMENKTIYSYKNNNNDKDLIMNKNLSLKHTATNSILKYQSRSYSTNVDNSNVNTYYNIIDNYIQIRSKNSRYSFSKEDIHMIDFAFKNVGKPLYNSKSLFLKPKTLPNSDFQSKVSDSFMIRLWNIIFPDAQINNIREIKEMSQSILHDFDTKYPSGQHMSEEELIRYITAHSSSSFLGIQLKSKSKFALDSLNKTIISHASYIYKDKPWLITNLSFIKNHLIKNKIMNKRYGDVCMYSKTSSTSIKNDSRNFRDYVFENTLNQVIDRFSSEYRPPYTITAAQRDSRRGKSRLICSFHADVRILDFYINNGSYDLCNYGGILSEYTTEGLSGMLLWRELVKMSKRDFGKTMICLDFKGYDTQISLSEYMQISKFLNYYRVNNDEFMHIFKIYEDWMSQPKMLLSQGLLNKEILIPYYKTLASGLHGTHSFENLIGISYALELSKRNIPVYLFKANGDDQNIMTHSSKIDDLMFFTNEYFDVEYSKSLIGHDLTVWGKKWFTSALYPVIEIGTIRSIWEREGGDVSVIEPSKFQDNYCKIINLIIFLYRLKLHKSVIMEIVIELCNEVGILHDRIPVSLTNFKQIKSGKVSSKTIPVGLESDRFYLESQTMDLNLIGSRNIYNMLRNSYKNKIYYSNEITDVKYHNYGIEFCIESNLDYSTNMESKVPWMLSGIEIPRLNEYQMLIRSVLQGTNSYDGPATNNYYFNDMYTLALAIHHRNRSVWFDIQTRIK